MPSSASILIRWLTLLVGVCFVVGVAGAGFLHGLAWVGRTFEAHLWLLWLLPFLGLAMTWIYARLTPTSAGGVRTLIAQIRSPGAPLPWAMGPAIIGTTLLSHLGGASVGREGTALQMGGALADRLGSPWRLSDEERRTLLLCGVSAGFGAVFGTPFAAAVFALEFVRLTAGWWWTRRRGRERWEKSAESSIGSSAESRAGSRAESRAGSRAGSSAESSAGSSAGSSV